MPAKKVEEILKLGQEPVSLEAPVGGEEGDASLGDFIEDEAGDRPLEIVANRIRDADLQEVLDCAALARAPRDRAALRPGRQGPDDARGHRPRGRRHARAGAPDRVEDARDAEGSGGAGPAGRNGRRGLSFARAAAMLGRSYRARSGVAQSAATFLDTLAWIQHLLKHDREAVTTIRRARSGGSQDPDLLWHAAVIYAAANDLAQASTELTLALKLKPELADREEVKRLRQQLTAAK